MNNGQYIFRQIMSFVSRYTFGKCVKKYDGDFRVKSLLCWEQFQAMLFGQLRYRESLRDVIICLKAQNYKLYHLGFSKPIYLPTLAKANGNRNWRIYAEFAQSLVEEARGLYGENSDIFKEIKEPIYALDSTTIDLCLKVFQWAPFRKNKAAIKLHTLIDLRGSIPTYILISDGKLHDVNAMDFIKYEAGGFYVMDRGYFDFTRLYNIHKSRAFYVTRLKVNIKWRRIYSFKIDKSKGLRCDQIIKFTSKNGKNEYPEKVRRIKFFDKEDKKYYEFITNNFDIDAQLVADLYKARWKVELFFKWIKQHLKIKVFWGESENAVKTQIWIAVCPYLIIAIIKKKLNLTESMYEILQILSISSCEKIPLQSLFGNGKNNFSELEYDSQLKIADF